MDNKLFLHSRLKRRVVTKFQIISEEELHLGIGRGEFELSTVDLPVFRDAAGIPLIPGSSLKGAIKTLVQRLLESLDLNLLKSSIGTEKVIGKPEDLKEFQEASEEEKENLFRKGALGVIDKLFGASGFAAPLKFTDALLSEARVDPLERTHVSIDLNTDKAKPGALLTLESLPSKTTLVFKTIYDEMQGSEMQDANRLFYRILEIANKKGIELFLGGWKSRGYGLSNITAVNVEVYTPETLVLAQDPVIYEGEEIFKLIKDYKREIGVAEIE